MGMEDLDPIETASLDELRSLQTERLRATIQHTYANVAHYREAWDATSRVAVGSAVGDQKRAKGHTCDGGNHDSDHSRSVGQLRALRKLGVVICIPTEKG